jgi:hypothetical protein
MALALRCVYCGHETQGDEPEDHPIPQALGTSDYALPRGAVCGDCNRYFASNLDQNLCDHHHLAAFIVLWQILGTGGRHRTAVTPDFSIDPRERRITVRPRRGEASIAETGLTIESEGNRRFCPWRFSRGLHRIGLGVLAMQAGMDVALDPKYDAVRRYIRKPASRREFWPTCQRIAGGLLPRIHVAFAIGERATYFYVNFVVSEFLVALDGNPTQLSDAERHQIALMSEAPVAHLSNHQWLHSPER